MKSKISPPPGRASRKRRDPRRSPRDRRPPPVEWHCLTCRGVGRFDDAAPLSTAELLDLAHQRHAVIQPTCRGRPQLRPAVR